MEHEKPSPSPARVYDPACLIKDCKVSVTKSTQANGSNKQLLPTPTVFGRCVVAVPAWHQDLELVLLVVCFFRCALFAVVQWGVESFSLERDDIVVRKVLLVFPTRCLDK